MKVLALALVMTACSIQSYTQRPMPPAQPVPEGASLGRLYVARATVSTVERAQRECAFQRLIERKAYFRERFFSTGEEERYKVILEARANLLLVWFTETSVSIVQTETETMKITTKTIGHDYAGVLYACPDDVLATLTMEAP